MKKYTFALTFASIGLTQSNCTNSVVSDPNKDSPDIVKKIAKPLPTIPPQKKIENKPITSKDFIGVWSGNINEDKFTLDIGANGNLVVRWEGQPPLFGTWTFREDKINLNYKRFTSKHYSGAIATISNGVLKGSFTSGEKTAFRLNRKK